MLRYLILALLVVLVVWWLLGRSRKHAASDRASAGQAPVSFTVCAHCGVHLPANEALLDGRLAYCSEAHRLAGPRERR